MKEHKVNITIRKTEMLETPVNGVYTFNLLVPDIAKYKSHRLYIKEFVVLPLVQQLLNFYQLKSNTLRYLNSYSTLNSQTETNNGNLVNNGNTLITVYSEAPYYISTGSFDDSLEITYANGKHNIWIEEMTNIPVDDHDFYVNFVLICYDY